MAIHEHNNIPRSFTVSKESRFNQPQVHMTSY